MLLARAACARAARRRTRGFASAAAPLLPHIRSDVRGRGSARRMLLVGRATDTSYARCFPQILARGPLSTAEYMRTCLSHPTLGYYMRRDVFGSVRLWQHPQQPAWFAAFAPVASSLSQVRRSSPRPTPRLQSGDFTTSPEVSPLFGELVGVFFVAALEHLGDAPFELVECGPGRGTLCKCVRVVWLGMCASERSLCCARCV